MSAGVVLALTVGRGLFVPSGAPPSGSALAMVRVVDGDTLVMPTGQRVRLQGIDAPELRQTCTRPDSTIWPCGREATAALARLVTGGVACRIDGSDRYGRGLARCADRDGLDLGAAMVRQGWALAYYSYSYAYAWDELIARFNRSGVWSGSFVRPSDFRRGAR
ncbi:MAG: thermonuclease family protein [Acetobacteraceae bacterium]